MADNSHTVELMRIIHRSGWTTPAEFIFVNSIVESLVSQVRNAPILLLLLAILTYAQNSTDDIAGVWRGNSNCMVKDSPCHDEVNVYRIAKVPGKPDWMTVTGSKIVNGSEVVMGTSGWKYDAAKHILDSPDGAIHLEITGNKIEGALTLPDKTVYRRIHLKKE